MTPEELQKHARRYIFDYFFENCRAPVLEEIMRRFALERREAHSLLQALESSHHILLVPETQRILMANPFSGITTPFKDSIGGKDRFTNSGYEHLCRQITLRQDPEGSPSSLRCASQINTRTSRGKEGT